MSSDWILWLGVGLGAGGLLGLAFFGGLMWTTRRLTTSRRPALLLAGSLVVRMTLVAVGFVVVTLVSPAALIGAVVGFVLSRVVLTRPTVIDRWFAGPVEVGEADG
jgi:F1F0 ATPase subunit 2